MSRIEYYLPLIQSHDVDWFSAYHPLLFLARQRGQELEPDGFANFQTPAQLPVLSLDQTPRPASSPASSSAMSRMSFTSEAEFCQCFAIDEVIKQAKNHFSQGITLGRAPNNDIVIPSRSVSKFHAWLEVEKDRYYIHDAQSSFGTAVDQILLQGEERRECYPGSKIRVGDVNLTLLAAAGLYQWVKARLALIRPPKP